MEPKDPVITIQLTATVGSYFLNLLFIFSFSRVRSLDTVKPTKLSRSYWSYPAVTWFGAGLAGVFPVQFDRTCQLCLLFAQYQKCSPLPTRESKVHVTNKLFADTTVTCCKSLLWDQPVVLRLGYTKLNSSRSRGAALSRCSDRLTVALRYGRL